jgi:hypothetical protein
MYLMEAASVLENKLGERLTETGSEDFRDASKAQLIQALHDLMICEYFLQGLLSKPSSHEYYSKALISIRTKISLLRNTLKHVKTVSDAEIELSIEKKLFLFSIFFPQKKARSQRLDVPIKAINSKPDETPSGIFATTSYHRIKILPMPLKSSRSK